MTIRLRPDHQWFRSPDGRRLIAGSPLTFFSVTEKGADILTLVENNDLLPDGHQQLTDRLVAAGAAHPLRHTPIAPDQLTVVIPAFVAHEHTLERLRNLVRELSDLTVIVVDDCSPEPFDVPGARVLRLHNNSGPGAARNEGLAEVTTPFVAFVDDDVSATTESLRVLASQLLEPHVVLVAPRVTSTNNGRPTGEYEQHYSPLDLGEHPTLVRPLSRVSYVPSAVFVCRTDTLRSVNGFDRSLRIGEDVDLVWRLAQAGHTCRYEPTISCSHEPRFTIRQLMRQRFSYGSSAALLAQRHGRSVTPFRANLILSIPALLVLLGYVWIVVPLLPFVYAWYVITLRQSGLSLVQRLRITTQGLTSTIRLLAAAISRAWWPLFFVASLVWFPAGFALFASLLVPAVYGLIRHRPHRVFGFMALRVLDNLAYGTGVWAGAIRHKSLRCLAPSISKASLRLRSKV